MSSDAICNLSKIHKEPAASLCLKVSRLLGKTVEKTRSFTFVEYDKYRYDGLQISMKEIQQEVPGWILSAQGTRDHYGPLVEDTRETTFLEAPGG